MAENTVRLRATCEVWDSVGCGAVEAEHSGLGSGDIVEVPREHARHLINKGGYVMLTEPVMIARGAPKMALVKHRTDPFCSPGGGVSVGDGVFLVPEESVQPLADHGFDLVKDERGRPVPVHEAPDPREEAVSKATDALHGMQQTLVARDQEIARHKAHIGELDKALSAAAEQNVILQAHVDELTKPADPALDKAKADEKATKNGK